MGWKNILIRKWSHVYKGYGSTHNVETLSSFNPELQLKDTESAIKNELMDFLCKLRESEFMTTLDLEFQKMESDDETKYDTFY